MQGMRVRFLMAIWYNAHAELRDVGRHLRLWMQQMEEKQEKTPEDLAAIACLDRLRNGEGESMPANLPRACVVEVTDYDDFHEILGEPLGKDVSARLRIDSLADLQAHLSAPRPKRLETQTFVPKAKRKPKKMSFFEKIKVQRDRLFG